MLRPLPQHKISIPGLSVARILQPDKTLLRIRSPLKLRVTKGQTLAIEPAVASHRARKDRALIAALRRAHAELQAHGIDASSRHPDLTSAKGIKDPYLRKLAALAFLAPDIQQAILAGQQPSGLTLVGIIAADLPLEWSAQRRLLGFAEAGPVEPLFPDHHLLWPRYSPVIAPVNEPASQPNRRCRLTEPARKGRISGLFVAGSGCRHTICIFSNTLSGKSQRVFARSQAETGGSRSV